MNPVTNNLLRVLCVGLLSLGGLTSAPVAWAIDPCCSITSINTNGRVTARELAGKRVFQFQVTDQAVLQSLRVGQQIHADFTAMKVSVRPDGISPCCAIVQVAAPKVTPPPVKTDKDTPVAGTKPDAAQLPAVKMPTVMGGTPCCEITSIAQNGQVTARQTSSKRVFQFQVNDKALLATLRPGQQIHADFGTQKVSVDGAEPCCQIVQPAGGIPDAAKIPAVKLPTVKGIQPCCSIVANPALKGRLGRLVLAFPQGANADNTRTYAYKDQTEIARFDGNKTLELMPGTYAVEITGKRVEGVTIQSGHETTVKVGMLRVTVGKDTRIYLLDTDRKRELDRFDGTQERGFPIGTVYVNVAGQSEAVTIQEGKITDF